MFYPLWFSVYPLTVRRGSSAPLLPHVKNQIQAVTNNYSSEAASYKTNSSAHEIAPVKALADLTKEERHLFCLLDQGKTVAQGHRLLHCLGSLKSPLETTTESLPGCESGEAARMHDSERRGTVRICTVQGTLTHVPFRARRTSPEARYC